MYEVGEVTDNHRFTFESKSTGEKPMDFALEDMFGSSPKVVMTDKNSQINYAEVNYSQDKIQEYLEQVLQLEAVACKDWLTNKVDRCVGGKVAKQQCAGSAGRCAGGKGRADAERVERGVARRFHQGLGGGCRPLEPGH